MYEQINASNLNSISAHSSIKVARGWVGGNGRLEGGGGVDSWTLKGGVQGI